MSRFGAATSSEYRNSLSRSRRKNLESLGGTALISFWRTRSLPAPAYRGIKKGQGGDALPLGVIFW